MKQGSAGPHAEWDDVAESPMEILTQTLMSGKELVCIFVCVDFSPPKLKEIIAICNVNHCVFCNFTFFNIITTFH